MGAKSCQERVMRHLFNDTSTIERAVVMERTSRYSGRTLSAQLIEKGGWLMRNISLFAMCVLLTACTSTPMFPPEIMKDIDQEAFDVKDWKEQTAHVLSRNFVPHKIEAEGRIIKVIQKPEGVVILAEEQPAKTSLDFGPKNDLGEAPFIFTVLFNGFPEVEMLEVGNRLAVVGVTDKVQAENIGWTPSLLPHILAQCLHIWDTQGVRTVDDFAYEGMMGYYLKEQTFCLGENKERILSSSNAQIK